MYINNFKKLKFKYLTFTVSLLLSKLSHGSKTFKNQIPQIKSEYLKNTSEYCAPLSRSQSYKKNKSVIIFLAVNLKLPIVTVLKKPVFLNLRALNLKLKPTSLLYFFYQEPFILLKEIWY